MRVDKALFNICMYLDKMYETERIGAKIYEADLNRQPEYAVIKKFTRDFEIHFSKMEELPQFLSYFWVLKKIYELLNKVFSLGRAISSKTALSNLAEDDFGLSKLLTYFSKDSKERKMFEDPSSYNALMEFYARLENVVVRMEASGKVFLMSNELGIRVDDFLNGDYLVLSSTIHSKRDIKSKLSFGTDMVTVKHGEKVLVASSTVRQAHSW